MRDAFATGDLGQISDAALKTGNLDAFGTLYGIQADQQDRAMAQSAAQAEQQQAGMQREMEQALAMFSHLEQMTPEQMQAEFAANPQPYQGMDAVTGVPLAQMTPEAAARAKRAMMIRMGRGPEAAETELFNTGGNIVSVTGDQVQTLYGAPPKPPAAMTENQRVQAGLEARRLDLMERELQGRSGGGDRGYWTDMPDPRTIQSSPFFQFEQAQGALIPAQFIDPSTREQGVFDDTAPDNQPGYWPGGSEYDKYRQRTQGATDTKRLAEINERANAIRNQGVNTLDGMESLLDQGAPVGPLPSARAALSKIFPDWVGSRVPGIPTQEQGAMLEQFNSLSLTKAMERIRDTKGAISNQEMDSFERAAPNWAQSEEGARRLIATYRAMERRTLEFQDAANTWDSMYGGLAGRNSDGLNFDEAWARYTRANPVFDAGSVVLPGGGIPAGVTPGDYEIDGQTYRAYEDGDRIMVEVPGRGYVPAEELD